MVSTIAKTMVNSNVFRAPIAQGCINEIKRKRKENYVKKEVERKLMKALYLPHHQTHRTPARLGKRRSPEETA